MTWMLVAWLCAASGDCRPVQTEYASRGACLRAERTLKHQETRLLSIHCHRIKPAPAS